jgi:thiol-disulfide isomerase/thioredoxin
MAAAIVRRIFATRQLPAQDASEADFKKAFDAAVTDFEEGGFLEQNKLTPIASEVELVDRLHDHRNDLVVLKFWKRGCLPCLGLAEMYKAAEQRYQGRRVHFYSMNTKADSALGAVAHQLVEGTPTVQVFHAGRQIGDEILSQNLAAFCERIDGYKRECGIPTD